VRPPPTEKSYHIFYQMMAGLNSDEKAQLGLDGFSIRDLLYLNMGDTRQDEVADAQRFLEWKTSLAILGIPFMDVVRVLAAVLLLGNVEFTPRVGDDAFDVEIIGQDELNSVAKLLGISTTILWQGITTRTHTVRGQPMKSMSDSHLVSLQKVRSISPFFEKWLSRTGF
jgi:dachs protein